MFLETAIAQRKSLAFPYLIFSKARQRLLHHAELKLGHGPYQHLSLEPLIVHVLFFSLPSMHKYIIAIACAHTLPNYANCHTRLTGLS